MVMKGFGIHRLAFDADLLLLHHLQQCGLRFGKRPVDFVRQQQIGEYGATPHREAFVFHVVEDVPGDIGRHQVWRELDARKLSREGFCQRASQQGFA